MLSATRNTILSHVQLCEWVSIVFLTMLYKWFQFSSLPECISMSSIVWRRSVYWNHWKCIEWNRWLKKSVAWKVASEDISKWVSSINVINTVFLRIVSTTTVWYKTCFLTPSLKEMSLIPLFRSKRLSSV